MFFRTLIAATLFSGAAMAVEAVYGPEPTFAPNVIATDGSTVIPDKPLRYADGSEGTLADYAGSALLVTLWQEHCPYCHVEMPKLDRLAAAMEGENVEIIAIALDQDMDLITGHLAAKGYTNLDAIMDVDKVNGTIFSAENFGRFTIATPTSFVIDPNGTVAATVWGLVDWDSKEARDYLRTVAAVPLDQAALLPADTTTPRIIR